MRRYVTIVIIFSLFLFVNCNKKPENGHIPPENNTDPVIQIIGHAEDYIDLTISLSLENLPLNGLKKNPPTILENHQGFLGPGQDLDFSWDKFQSSKKIIKPDTIYFGETSSASRVLPPRPIPVRDMISRDINPAGFMSYDKLQGLAHSFVTCMLEDVTGNIWFGTHGGGVSRFDGSNFVNFTTKEGLAGNSVFCMAQASDNAIWFGTHGNGICVYDGVTFKYLNEDNGLTSNNIYNIYEDGNKNIWVAASEGGLLRFNPSDISSALHYSAATGLPHGNVTCVFEDHSGGIWVGTDGNGFFCFRENAVYTFECPDEISNAAIVDMDQDAGNNLWISTYGGGLIKYDGHSMTLFTTDDNLPSNHLTSCLTDANHSLWIGTDGGGVGQISGINDEFPAIISFTEADGLSNSNIYSILKDRSNNLWFGSLRGGVNIYHGNKFSHFESRISNDSNHIFGIIEDDSGNIWLNAYGKGLLMIEKTGDVGSWKQYRYFTTNEGLSNDFVYSSIKDSSGRLWFGTNGGGVNIIENNMVRIMDSSHGLASDKVISLFEDSKGNIWMGSSDGEGVSVYDGKTLTAYSKRNKLFNSSVFSISEDIYGRIWFGTDGDGIIIFDNGIFLKVDQDDGLINDHIFCIRRDSDGNMWVGTEGSGLFVFNGSQFLHADEKIGLTNDFVFSILEDHNQDLWIGTRFGVSILTNERKKLLLDHLGSNSYSKPADTYFANYTYEDGFLGVGCNRGAIFQSSDLVVWIGSTDRLTISGMAKDGRQYVSASSKNTLVTEVLLFNERINWREFKDNPSWAMRLGNGVTLKNVFFSHLTPWYYLPADLKLRHDNNYVSFNYNAITQDQPSKVKYQYRMDGLTENWSSWVSATTAAYSNLAPGKYIFIVKSRDGQGNISPPVSFSFEIKQPWWFTPWMKIVYSIAAIIALYFVHVSQKNRTIKNERLKIQEKEIAQAREVEKAYKELKLTQAQLIQAEKMASLGELTAGIAHEIQNPLNFVNNFSDVSGELLDEMTEEFKQGDLEEGFVIAGDLKQNLEKISHHGKRAEAIVRGMLQHSRSSTGQKEPTDINVLADEYLRLAYHGMRAKDKSFNAEFKTDFDLDLPKVDAVSQDMGRVLLNLINNAFQAVDARSKNAEAYRGTTSVEINNGQDVETLRAMSLQTTDYTPTVTVSTKNRGDHIEISVRDNGPGIPEEIINKIFQPFFTTKPTGQGTGLGLSLSYDVVKAHGGELLVESEPGHGSAFIVRIPVPKNLSKSHKTFGK